MNQHVISRKTLGAGSAALLILDEYAQNPRREGENITTLVTWRRNLPLSDEHQFISPRDFLDHLILQGRPDIQELLDDNGIDGIRECPPQLRKRLRNSDYPGALQVVYILEHGGVSLSTRPFQDPWDSGPLGYIWIPRETILRMDLSHGDADRIVQWDLATLPGIRQRLGLRPEAPARRRPNPGDDGRHLRPPGTLPRRATGITYEVASTGIPENEELDRLLPPDGPHPGGDGRGNAEPMDGMIPHTKTARENDMNRIYIGHGAFEGPEQSFLDFQEAMARLAGITTDPDQDYTDRKYTDRKMMGNWRSEGPGDIIEILTCHHYSDGWFNPQYALPLAWRVDRPRDSPRPEPSTPASTGAPGTSP